MGLTPSVLRSIERKTGKTIAELQRETLSERRERMETLHGRVMRIVTFFPFIGRGTVMGDHIMSHEEVEKQFKKAVR